MTFPLVNKVVTLEYGQDVFGIRTNFKGSKILNEKATDDRMTDLDYNSDGTIDTIGDATNEAKGQSFDLNMQSEWYKAGATKVSFLGGYRYDEYDFVAYDPRTLFWDEAIDTSQYPLLYDGVGITYNTKYSMPYIGGVMKYEKGKFELGLTAKYSPIASVEDEDDHKMRYKLNTSEADGSMVIASLKANTNKKINLP